MTPQKIADISEPIEKIYSSMTDDLLLNISKHLKSSTTTWTALGEIETLTNMGQLTEENIKIINSYVQQIPQAVKDAMNESRLEALAEIEDKLALAANNGYLTKPVTDGTVDVVKAFSGQAIDQLNLVNQTMLNSSLQAYQSGMYTLRQGMRTAESEEQKQEAQEIIDFAAGKTVIGSDTRTNALRTALKQLNYNGITGFYDRIGRSWSAEAYVNMDIRTTVHNTYIQSIKARQEDYGSDVFQVSTHSGARPLCYPYQGKLYSWGESGGYITLGDGKQYRFKSIKETSYGEPAGLFGINCGHVPYPMIVGVSEPVKEKKESKAENDKEYQESQEQRSLERQIRYYKRELEMLGNMATEADKQKLLDAQAAMREFIKDTGRTRRYDREQIVTDKEQRNKSNTVKTPKPSEQSTNKSFKNLIKGAKNRKIEYLEVKDSGEIPSTLEAYKRLAGSDMTKGSCVSVALAYIGQRSGWDVRDFRGGESQEYFSLNGNNRELKRLTGVKAIEVDGTSSIEAGKELLGKLTDTKEYLIMVGRHASIVRRNTAGDMMYLEMQSKAQRGWHTMYSEEQTLRDRFGCNDDVDPFWKKDGFAIATEQLTGSQELKEILGYINTESGKEEIGSGGSIK